MMKNFSRPNNNKNDNDDDLYNKFSESSGMEALFYEMETQDNTQGNNFVLKTAERPYSRGNTRTGFLKSSRNVTTSSGGDIQIGRPSTAVRGIGYTSEAGKMFDPMLHQKSNKKTANILIGRKSEEPNEKYKNLEIKIQNLLEESILASTGSKPNYSESLNKAKEASSLDRTLLRLRDQNDGSSFHNFDLTYSVFFNLAHQYTKNEMYIEALNTYNIMTKNKMFPNVNRLKMNMGNIYFKMGIYPKAIKMYRMALDQVPNNHKELRLKITHNIGILFIKMGLYTDAAASFEYIMSECGDLKCGIHLVLCYYAIGDIEKIKIAFKLLIDIQLDYDDDIRIQTADLDDNSNNNQMNQYIFEKIKNDELSLYYGNKRKIAEKSITMIVDLISNVIEDNFNDGYSWCLEVIKSSNFAWLANELELNKALVYLKQNDINQAIETLRFYEKKDPSMAVNAITNLTFIYLHLGDLQNATKYAEKCRQLDTYNPAAFINSGVCEMLKGDLNKAREYFELALTIDMTSFEATYNLGLVLKRLGDITEAENLFNKIKLNLSHAKHSHIYYQLAKIHELNDNKNLALDLYLQLLGILSSSSSSTQLLTSNDMMDSKLYQKIGEIYENFNDHQEANQYYSEAYRINPSDVNVATSIGSYFIKLQAFEKAIYYYERAILADPNDANLMLRVASCLRHIYTPKKYLQLFEKIHKKFPENLDCLKALIHVTKSQGMTELHEKYSNEYERLERILETRRKISSGGSGVRHSGMGSSGSSSGLESSKRRSAKSPRYRDSGDSNRSSSSRHPSANIMDMTMRLSNDNSIREQQEESWKADYADPLGPPAERPKTGQINRSLSKDSDDEFNAEELLPF